MNYSFSLASLFIVYGLRQYSFCPQMLYLNKGWPNLASNKDDNIHESFEMVEQTNIYTYRVSEMNNQNINE